MDALVEMLRRIDQEKLLERVESATDAAVAEVIRQAGTGHADLACLVLLRAAALELARTSGQDTAEAYVRDTIDYLLTHGKAQRAN